MNTNEIIRCFGTEYKDMTVRLLGSADLVSLLPENKDCLIAIKPNLVSPTPASFGATTHPEIVEGIIEYLNNNNYRNIAVIEGSWVGDKTEDAFEFCGYNRLAKEYGIRLVDTQKDDWSEVEGIKICKSVADVDFLINVPVLKGHAQTLVTCALKNMKGLIPNMEKRRFHRMGLHRPIALLNSVLHQDFIVVDNICGDPVFEDGGNPVVRNCVMAARDPVLVDTYACKLLGIDAKDVEYISLSNEFGIGNADLENLKLIVTEGEELEVGYETKSLHEIKNAVEDVESCSACYEVLMVALDRIREEGKFEQLEAGLKSLGETCENVKIGIGQGYRGKSGIIGVGNCTKGFELNIPGCPPNENDIYDALIKITES